MNCAALCLETPGTWHILQISRFELFVGKIEKQDQKGLKFPLHREL